MHDTSLPPVYARPELPWPPELHPPYLAFLEAHTSVLGRGREIQKAQCMGLGKLSGAPGERTCEGTPVSQKENGNSQGSYRFTFESSRKRPRRPRRRTRE